MTDYALMNQLLYQGKAADIKRMTEEALEEGLPVKEILTEGLIAGMSVVGEDFKHMRLYVPQVLIAARAMKAGMSIIKPLLSETDDASRGTIVMGTVQGDLHDIGKNLVCMMAEGAGFEIVDLGVDTSAAKFIEAAHQHNPLVIGMSALLTTTMLNMEKVINAFQEEGLGHIKMCIGGAPITQVYADKIGADGYAGDAASAVDLFIDFAEKLKANATAHA